MTIKELADEFENIESMFYIARKRPSFFWIGRKSEPNMNTVDAHYEIVDYGSSINLELHFEGKNKEEFYKIIGDNLDAPCTWFDWEKDAPSIRYKEYDKKQIKTNEILEDLKKFDDMIFEKVKEVLTHNAPPRNQISYVPPLNQILYGPPGTGKTYATITKALEIIDGTAPEEREERFSELKNVGQIEFLTFHQSYGYEEFVEGIGVDVDSGTLKYDLKDGIFKNISDKAAGNIATLKSKKDNIINIELLLNDFAAYIDEQEEIEGDRFTLRGKDGKKYKDTFLTVFRDSKSEFQSFETLGAVNGQRLTKKIILRDYQQFFDGNITSKNEVKPSKKSSKVSHGNASYYFLLYERIKEFQQSEEALEPNKYTIRKTNKQNYVLIIDEINRGNISKIFGELITLIEPSKRLGAKDELTLTLPYSQEEFGVPENLYIIGTMNTADRSIALLDTALRRRFEFVEMMPQHEHISADCEGINLQELLKAINERIEYLYDRDHCIGHTYFLDIKSFAELQDVFKNKIIPLLQEYFYDDWEKIKRVLHNNGFVQEKPAPKNMNTDGMEERKLFRIDGAALEEPANYTDIYQENDTSNQE